ncbi:exported hypothetical protein [Mesorhizobium plurifarium]|uniref:Uncharacterized protein n=1 Tax=Mesorhizobium plurifarium TaxID=69974 RepID=A0A090FVA8_MESPL|nr:exported hypothetical protein [Mesorhizobium plurifarium]
MAVPMPDRGTVRSVTILVVGAGAAGVLAVAGAGAVAGTGGVAAAGGAPGAADGRAGAGEAAGGAGFAAFGAPSCGTQAATARSSGMVIDTRTVWPKLMRCPFVRGTLQQFQEKCETVGLGAPSP